MENFPYNAYALDSGYTNTPASIGNTSYQHILSMRRINAPYQRTLSKHYINTPYQHTLSTHPINAPYQRTLSTHFPNNYYGKPCEHSL